MYAVMVNMVPLPPHTPEIYSKCASVASYGYVPSSPIIVTLMKEALSSSET
jgi:hypothetical protein